MEREAPDQDDLGEIYDALDRGDAVSALHGAHELLRDGDEDDPVVRFLAGLALLELDRAEEAADQFARAAELDPDDAEFRTKLAWARFASCRFEEALREARSSLAAEPGSAEAHYVVALGLERTQAWEEADEHFARAASIDADSFPRPRRIAKGEFDRTVQAAAERLPEPFRRPLQDVDVRVEAIPSLELLTADEPPLEPELFGLFIGHALTERSTFSPGGELPPTILLFQRNLERFFPDPDELRDEIARTLYHELGHYLGMDENDLAEIDLD